MGAFARLLARIGDVVSFDYGYQLAGRRAPDRLPVLVSTHRARFEQLRAERGGRLVLIGKSMGGRVGCHVAAEVPVKPDALVCLGYPLVGANGARRDAILQQLATPILFVQGTHDPMCPLGELAKVRRRMTAPSELYVVQGGDHSLSVRRRVLAERGLSDALVSQSILEAIGAFIDRHTAPSSRAGPNRKGR